MRILISADELFCPPDLHTFPFSATYTKMALRLSDSDENVNE